MTREEERQRLRRDLHDGLGPTLAGVALQIETVRGLIRDDPDAADTLLARLEDETHASIASIRKIVYGLRPPALDELGLVGALREEGTRFAANGRGLQVSIRADRTARTVRGRGSSRIPHRPRGHHQRRPALRRHHVHRRRRRQ